MARTEANAETMYDPRGLIREAYRIDGISMADCRSVFLDWALGLANEHPSDEAVRALLTHHADQPDDHPMTTVLRESLETAARPRRRGGASGRRS